MIKSMVSAAILCLLLAGPALAQSAPPTETAKPAGAAPAATQPAQPHAAEAAKLAPAAAPAETAEAPSTIEACITSAADLGSVAEGKTLSEDKLERLDELFSKMETLCDGKQFAEAMAVAGDIKTMLNTQ